MKVTVQYLHAGEGKTELNSYRKSPDDHIRLFFCPEGGETLLFDEQEVSYEQFAAWAREYAGMEESLHTIGVETREETDDEK